MEFLGKLINRITDLFDANQENNFTPENDKEKKDGGKKIDLRSHEEILNSIGNKEDAKVALLDALKEAASDGQITAEELTTIEELKNTLELDEKELSQIRVKFFRKVIENVLADHRVTEEEMKLLNELHKGLKFTDSEMIRLLSDYQKVQKLYAEGKVNY